MEIGQHVWIWNVSGDVTSGTIQGKDGDWLFINIGSHTISRMPDKVFTTEMEAKAWQLVKRVKRLLSRGVPMDEIIHPEDKEVFDKALELFPEELI